MTLVGLEAIDVMSGELIPERRRAKGMSKVLDDINRRYGNNALYFGAMQKAIAQGAAPMRIPFSTIPDTALEDEMAPRSPRRTHQSDEDYELWLQRERQFKVLAENTHRQKNLPPSTPAFRCGRLDRENACDNPGNRRPPTCSETEHLCVAIFRQTKRNPAALATGFRGKDPGDDLLSHGLIHTTIGACAFHFRVRDGIGWFHALLSPGRGWRVAGRWTGLDAHTLSLVASEQA